MKKAWSKKKSKSACCSARSQNRINLSLRDILSSHRLTQSRVECEESTTSVQRSFWSSTARQSKRRSTSSALKTWGKRPKVWAFSPKFQKSQRQSCNRKSKVARAASTKVCIKMPAEDRKDKSLSTLHVLKLNALSSLIQRKPSFTIINWTLCATRWMAMFTND